MKGPGLSSEEAAGTMTIFSEPKREVQSWECPRCLGLTFSFNPLLILVPAPWERCSTHVPSVKKKLRLRVVESCKNFEVCKGWTMKIQIQVFLALTVSDLSNKNASF